MQSFDRLRMRGKRLRMKVLVDEDDSKIKMRLPWSPHADHSCFPAIGWWKGLGIPVATGIPEVEAAGDSLLLWWRSWNVVGQWLIGLGR